MARKNNGGFGRVLNMIGLVDDQENQDRYDDEYDMSDYGRQPAYTPRSRATRPQPQQQQRSRQSAPVRRDYAPSFEPTRPQRSSVSPRVSSSRFDQPQRTSSSSAAARRFDSSASRTQVQPRGYDYSPRTSRFASSDDDYGANYAEPEMNNVRGGNGRTAMYALHTLEDVRDVIDNLILNTTVVLTLDSLDPQNTQRAIDMLSGAVFALHATICKASASTYLIAPKGVQVNETYETDRRF